MSDRSPKDETIKDAVPQSYSSGIRQARGSCCGPEAGQPAPGAACCASPSDMQGRVAGMAGDAPVERQSLPGEAAGKIGSAHLEGVKRQPATVAGEVEIDLARPEERAAAQALLRGADLPADVEACGDELLVARHGGRVVACIGMERRDGSALFRSLAVAPEYRGLGLAHRLYQALEARAVARGVTQACLLTASILPLAERWGFRRVDRCALPAALRDTSELRAACCATAHAMVKTLAPSSPACCGHT
jgi:amino-acid N-acetyltransferase